MVSRKKLYFEILENRIVLSSSLRTRILLPAQQFVKEDIISSINLKVIGKESNLLTLTMTASNGNFLIENNPRVQINNLNNQCILKGKAIDINQTLKSLKYQSPLDSNKSESLTVNVFNGVKNTIAKSRININPINDSPSIFLKNTFLKNGFVNWNEQAFRDPDSKKISVTLNSNNKIQVLDSSLSVKNLGNKSIISGDISKVNEIFSNYGKIKIFPQNKDDINLTISVSDGRLSSTKNIIVYQKESLLENATNAVFNRINGKDQNIAKPIFSLMDHENSIYKRNVNGWTYDLDLTCVSPWNSAGGNYLAGTLISPRHIVYATHYQLPIGAKIRFITKDNIVVERTIINKSSPQYTGMYFPDITVGLLDSDVPSSITFAKILPEDYTKYINPNSINIYSSPPGSKIPCLALDQEEKAIVTGLYNLNASGYALFDKFIEDPYSKFFENIISGDSGNPAFLIIDNQLVLVTVWTFGGGGSGTSILTQKSSINKIMKDLGGGYQLTEIDLSKFGEVT